VDHAAPEAAPLVRALLVHELQVPDLLVLDQLALVERVRDPLPLVPQVCDQLVRELVGHVLQGALIGQRAA
jgi:hypothetical protein